MSLEDQNIDEEADAPSGLSPGQSLSSVMWGRSHLVAEEILGSSSFLLHLRSGSITQSCYDRFSRQEALYLGLVHRTLEASYDPDADPDTDPEVGCLLLDTKELYRSRSFAQDPAAAPRWLRFALQSFHFVVVDNPLYLLVALSARSFLNSFVLESVPLPGFMRSPESESLYQRWREEAEEELTLTHRFKDVIEKHQNKSDIYKTINVFREHLMNQKILHRHIECEE
ncbi:uncharacterized protein LOC117386489 [Periophthalmus magnuspinnatus]|uniref:uncharacterized protein LOC117386489 n=1 Tax=Periophthalmus magnuspinnatus TaxID=409849 RepID=UPI00145A2FE9|nr:uncharacterized protein LOC117386489 [Periophthalmus magnuspinnatus]XP_055085088.1 uncharacterized protein LOC117386489 [Periophthalmus magnuspinnatus]XP_055085089.1 uncharacterized protein LOC117386489 [Periophthalmus magnuspinnatus]XP_055085090.1 uncharacterized protein LOC117386489 [Periophthalmus magnuspinnatus]